MVIYFLLCCVYGNFLISMEWSFIFYQKCWNVLHCIFHDYCGIVFFFSHSEVSFSWENRLFIWRGVLKERGLFYGLFYYVCSLCILLCFHFPREHWLLVSAMLHSHILNGMTKQRGKFSQLTSELRLIISFESVVLHPQRTQIPGHWEAQTDINSGCKAFASSVVAIVHSVFVLCEATACDDAFFFSFLDYFSYSIKMFYQLHWFYALCKW